MRRMFWAGVVGTLIYLPVRLHDVSEVFSSVFQEGPVFSSDNMLPIDSAHISIMMDLFIYILGYYTPQFILYVLIWLSAIYIAVRTGVIGPVRPLGSGKIKGFLINRPGGFGGFVFGVLSAVLLYSLSTYFLPFEHVFLSDTNLWYQALFFMGGPGMAIIYFAVLKLSMLFFVFGASVLGYVFITYKDRTWLITGAKVSFVAIGIGGLWLVALSEGGHAYDMRKDLNDVINAERDLKPECRDFHVLAEMPVSARLSTRFHEMTYMDDGETSSVYSPEGVHIAEKYLQENGVTLLNGPLNHYIIHYYERRFEFDEANEWRYKLFMSSGDNGPAFTLKSLRYTNSSESSLALVNKLADETQIYVPEKSYYTVASMYLNQGDINKAKRWHERAEKAVAIGTYKGYDMFEMPETAPFHDGCISGRIMSKEGPVIGVGVGIVVASNLSTLENWMSKIETETFESQSCLRLVRGGSQVDNEGHFTITGIHEGEYLLVLSVPVSDGNMYSVINPPGVMTISKDIPVADVGTINLVEQNRFPDAVQY